MIGHYSLGVKSCELVIQLANVVKKLSYLNCFVIAGKINAVQDMRSVRVRLLILL